MAKRASLAELMGKDASEGLSLSKLPDILGEAMPELPKNAVGRHRLIRALQQRFGNNYRSLPGVKDLVSEFDKDVAFESKVKRMSAIRYSPKGK